MCRRELKNWMFPQWAAPVSLVVEVMKKILNLEVVAWNLKTQVINLMVEMMSAQPAFDMGTEVVEVKHRQVAKRGPGRYLRGLVEVAVAVVVMLVAARAVDSQVEAEKKRVGMVKLMGQGVCFESEEVMEKERVGAMNKRVVVIMELEADSKRHRIQNCYN